MKLRFLLSFASATLLAAAPLTAQAQDSQPKWHGHIEAEGKWGTERSLGEVGLFLPVWQDEDTMVFGDIRGRLDDHDSGEGNFGIGLRHQMDGRWILGGYAFYDRRETANDNSFDQATVGVEALSENLEFRVNGYIPESDEKDAGTATSVGIVNGANLQVNNFGAPQERALPGFDAEAGYKFDIGLDWDVWAYAGGFHFDASGYDNVSGPRGRLEFSYESVPYLGDGSRFTVGVEAQHDDVRDGQAFGIARLRIPLNYNGARAASALSALDKRMTSRIYRDVDIVAGEQEAPLQSTEAASFTLENGTDVGTFTTIDATDNIAADVTAAGANSLVVVDGSAGQVDTGAIVAAQNGQAIIGGGAVINVTGNNSGNAAMLTLPGTRPTVNGTNGGLDPVQIFGGADNVTLQNITVSGGAVGISINGSDGTVLRDVTITDTGDDSLRFNNVDGALITNVDMVRPSGGGEEAVQFEATTDNIDFVDVTVTDANHGFLFTGIGGGPYDNTSFSNVTVDTVNDVVQVQGGATANNPSGDITATNFGGLCNNGGTINGSTLDVNGASCP